MRECSTEHVDDEGDVDPAGEGLDVSQVRHPETVRRDCHELAINEIARSVLVLVADGRQLELATAPSSAEPLVFHQAPHRAVRDSDVLAIELLPDLLGAVDAVAVGLVHARNLGLQGGISDLARTRRPDPRGVIRAGGELQDSADRLDSPLTLARVDVAHYLLV